MPHDADLRLQSVRSTDLNKVSATNGLEIDADNEEFLKEAPLTLTAAAQQRLRPSMSAAGNQKYLGRIKMSTVDSPDARTVSGQYYNKVALLHVDGAGPKLATPATATHAASGAGFNHFGSNTLNSSLDMFTEQMAAEMRSFNTTHSFSRPSRTRALAMGPRTLSGKPPTQAARSALRKSVHLKGKLKSTRMTSGPSRKGRTAAGSTVAGPTAGHTRVASNEYLMPMPTVPSTADGPP